MHLDTIVVGVDFSPPSARALVEARTMADTMGYAVDVVHVVPNGENGDWSPGGDERAWLEGLRLDRRALWVRRGTPWVELVRHADEIGARLIVVGSHGRGGYHPVSLGSTAFRLAVGATRPVLVVGRRTAGSAVRSAPRDQTTEVGSTDLP